VRDFIVIFSCMHTMYFEQIHPLHYISILSSSAPPLSGQCLVGFIMLSSYVHMYICNVLQFSLPLNILYFLPPTSSSAAA
jgi:hypothetical protein